MCSASDEWLITADGETRYDLLNGREVTFEMVFNPQTDHVIVLSTRTREGVCDATGAAIGRFDPVPEPPAKVTEADVRAPLD